MHESSSKKVLWFAELQIAPPSPGPRTADRVRPHQRGRGQSQGRTHPVHAE